MLGPAPALVKASKRPEHNPGPRLLTPSDQGSATDVEGEGSASRNLSGAGAEPEMAQARTQPQAEGLPPRYEQIGRAR